jgi:hypothetical protein
MAMDPAFANALSVSEAFYTCSALLEKEKGDGREVDSLDKVRVCCTVGRLGVLCWPLALCEYVMIIHHWNVSGSTACSGLQ